MVKKAGFTDVKVYNGFSEEEYSINSFATVLVAKKLD